MSEFILKKVIVFYSKKFIPSVLRTEKVSIHGLILGAYATEFFYAYKIHDLKIMEHLQLYEKTKDEIQLNYVKEYIQSVWGKNANIATYEINPEFNGEVLLRVKLLVK